MKSNLQLHDVHDSGDTLPEQANVYVPPRPLAQISDHRTIDVKAIRIAAELDPRQAKTELRMYAPPRQRRGLPLFVVGLAVVLALFGVAVYMEFAREPLPLMTTEATQARPTPELTQASPASGPAAGATTAATALGATNAPTEPATATVPARTPAAPVSVRAPRPKSGAARTGSRKKVTPEPWLD